MCIAQRKVQARGGNFCSFMGRGVELGYIIPLTGQTGKLKKLDKLEMD